MMILKIFLTCIFLLYVSCCVAEIENNKNRRNTIFLNEENYLSKPTGNYKVGFKDFHWVNQNICSDVNFTGKNAEDFSSDNKKYCREIIVRIYYPSISNNRSKSFYYKPFVKWQKKDLLEKLPTIPKEVK